MSPRQPVVSGKRLIVVLEGVGYRAVRQKGSHVRLRHADSAAHRPVTVPLHGELRVGLLRAILRDAGITPEEFARLLEG
jgi:predicted RNA binding protein YcfA (HicA-like mRNA interferase family)